MPRMFKKRASGISKWSKILTNLFCSVLFLSDHPHPGSKMISRLYYTTPPFSSTSSFFQSRSGLAAAADPLLPQVINAHSQPSWTAPRIILNNTLSSGSRYDQQQDELVILQNSVVTEKQEGGVVGGRGLEDLMPSESSFKFTGT